MGHFTHKNKICTEAAAEILEHLCTHYTNDDEYLGKLKKAMTDAMPVVIGAILRCGDKTHTGKDGFAKPETDIENQCVKGKGISSSSSSHLQNGEQDEEEKAMLSSLLSLCGTVYDMLISELGLDLAPQFDASSFLNKLKEIVVKQSEPTVENMSVFKAITKMVIAMMKHSGSRFVKQEDLESLIEALSSASKNMLDLEHSMVFLSAASISETTLMLDRCTLSSLVKKAQEMHVMMPSASVSG